MISRRVSSLDLVQPGLVNWRYFFFLQLDDEIMTLERSLDPSIALPGRSVNPLSLDVSTCPWQMSYINMHQY